MQALPTVESSPALSPELEQPLVELETTLNLLGEALLKRDSQAIEAQSAALHQALARAMMAFTEAAKHGKLPQNLRNRLVMAGGRVAAQRETLARASVSLDRAIDLLIPPEPSTVYGASGKTVRRTTLGGSIKV